MRAVIPGLLKAVSFCILVINAAKAGKLNPHKATHKMHNFKHMCF